MADRPHREVLYVFKSSTGQETLDAFDAFLGERGLLRSALPPNSYELSRGRVVEDGHGVSRYFITLDTGWADEHLGPLPAS